MIYGRLFFISWFFSFAISCFIMVTISCYFIKKTKIVTTYQTKKIVIFDLGNVLIRTNNYKALQFLGIKDALFYRIFNWKSFNALQQTLCLIIDTYHLPLRYTPLCDAYGVQLPHLFSEMLKGTHTELIAYPIARKALEKSVGCFYNKREERLCKKIAELMFNPEVLIETQELIKEGVLLLKQCIDCQHEVFICSNMTNEMFELLKIKFPELFSLIPEENIIISAQVKAVKPEPSMYSIVCKKLKKIGFSPTKKTCVFIDDQLENIEGLKNFPISGIHKKTSFKSVKKALKKQGFLKK